MIKLPLSSVHIVILHQDYGMSIGYSRDDLNFEKNNAVTKKILEIASLAKNNNTQLVVGGAISLESINILKSIQNIYPA